MPNDNPSDPSPTKPLSSEEENRILWDPRKPNWDEWENVTQTKLWVAIALAQNIEPKHFDYFRTGKLDTKFTQQPPQFTILLTRAINDISPKGMLKPIFIDWGSLADSEIKLSNFVKWINSIKVELPPKFPGTTGPNPTPKDQSSPDKNERSTLLTLIAVLAKELQLDISHPSKTAVVIDGLTTRLGARVSARAIENHLNRIGTAYPKSLGEKERTTLLILIAALCKEFKLDISNSTRAASLIEGLTSKGAHIAAATIEGCLSRIPKALEKHTNKWLADMTHWGHSVCLHQRLLWTKRSTSSKSTRLWLAGSTDGAAIEEIDVGLLLGNVLNNCSIQVQPFTG